MAESTEGQEQHQTQQVQIDAAQLQSSIDTAIQAAMANVEQQRQQAEAQRAEEARQAQARQQQDQDPMLRVMAPYLQPLQLQTQSAIDAATFYVTHPEAAQYKDELEQVHRTWLDRGITVTRDEAWAYVRGKHHDEFVERSIKQRDEAATNAANAQSLGAGMTRIAGTGQVKRPQDMTPEELEAALEGVYI